MKKLEEQIPNDNDTAGNLRRWIGFFLPPVAWAIQLQTLYLTSFYGCISSDFRWNHVVSIAAILVSVFGGVITWRSWPPGEYEPTKEKGEPVVRKRFMGILGLAAAFLFTVVIIAQWLPTLLGVPCSK